MTSQLTESVDDTLTDTVTFTYTQSSGVFDEYIFTLTNSDKPPVSRSHFSNRPQRLNRDQPQFCKISTSLSKQSLVFIHFRNVTCMSF